MNIRFKFKFLLLLIVSVTFLFCENTTLSKKYEAELNSLESKISASGNVWIVAYDNYQTYYDSLDRVRFLKSKLKELGKVNSGKNREIADKYSSEIDRLQKRIDYLSKLKNIKNGDRLGGILNFKELDTSVEGSLGLYGAIKELSNLEDTKENYDKLLSDFNFAIGMVRKEKAILTKLYSISVTKWQGRLNKVSAKLDYFIEKRDALLGVYKVYLINNRILRENIHKVLNDKYVVIFRYIIIIVVILVALFLFRFISRRVIKDHNKHYFTNKVLTLIVVLAVIVIFLSSQLSNISGLTTLLGFASAGIAIAMKDIFMSFFGWFYITISGTIRVGDRVKVITNSGVDFAFGDVLDISFLRITAYEEISFTNVAQKSAGRVIFIPNNYIFIHLIANYSHKSMSTTWEEVEIIVTFDSNLDKAKNIVKDVARRYSFEYMKMAETQISDFRTSYNIRNIEVEPRMFTLIEPYGMKITCFFLTYAFATLKLKSDISLESVKRLIKEDDIMLAYPTRHLVAMQDEDHGQMDRLREDEI